MARRRISIFRSLHRANLIVGVERDLLFPIAIGGGLVIITSNGNWLKLLFATVAIIGALTLARMSGKADPIMTKVWKFHMKHKEFYPAKDSPFSAPSGAAYRSHRTKEPGLQSLLQYAVMIDNGLILCKDGSFFVGYQLTTRDTASSTESELASFSSSISTSTKELGDGWSLHFNCIRSPEEYYPGSSESFFPDPVTRAIDDERRELFRKEGKHFRTSHYLFLSWRPNLASEKINSFFYTETGGETRNRKIRADEGEKALARFKEELIEIEDRLKISFTLHRLKDIQTQSATCSELLEIISYCITGERHPVLLPQVPMYLDVLLSRADITGGVVPRVGEKHIAALAIDGFPHESFPMMLDTLDSLSIPYRFSSRFICMDPYTASRQIEDYSKAWSQKMVGLIDKLFNKRDPRVNRDAAMMHEDAEEARFANQLGDVGFGYYSGNVILLNEDRDTLAGNIRDIRKTLLTQGFGCRLETINSLEAWLGTHPGNNYANMRRVILHTLNLADILPLSTVYAGHKHCPCPFYPENSPPLLYAATQGSTPFRLNLHFGDLGHTLIFGPTGSGKSVLLATIAAQFRRYRDASIYCFDKGGSMYPLAAAAGGTHYEIAGDDSKLAFCPLQQVDTDSEQAWAEDWITTLCAIQKVDIKPHHRAAIHDAMTQIRHNLPSHRTMSNLYHFLQNQELKEAIKHYTVEGAMGRLLDAEKDNLDISGNNFSVFEIEELMNLGEENLIPVLLYLFHRIEKSFTGQPSLLILDEAWIMLGHPVFRAKIREWLKVLRKANCAVVLATQSLSDAKDSGILDVLYESCPTKIFLPNMAADKDTQRDLYRALGLNSTQIGLVSKGVAKREYYVTNPEGCRMINLSLSPLALSFVGASGKDDIGAIKDLQREHGSSWPEIWLQKRNVARRLS
ncbi:VirB4 family type IV secretion/conjugal transfer ATPase [Desulforhopalus singaporensis]|uniref:Type IV secretion system protein VirB4 n=1 Tax=Desulforhopalus singaporensis TaxID=91360 RepID=A0A1H0PBT3_9BACT|nr:VirB3 family type IV secretion system protein [Desulforhopalus singaporensis]SDP02118.1 type IV secretion system protein VirB4 [Desulforhopalus singaporensis]